MFKSRNVVHPVVSVILVTAAYFVVYSSQVTHRPEKCIGNPEFLQRFCCAFPPFFTWTVSKKCGAGVELMDDRFNVTKFMRRSFSCHYWYCLLDQYGLITPTSRLDHEKFFNHLDLWVTLNPSFTDVMIEAKLNCKQFYRFFFPLRVCEFYKIHYCVRRYISVYCPVIIPRPECEKQQQFYKECGVYFT